MKTYILIAEEAGQHTTVVAFQAESLQEAAAKFGLEKTGEAPAKTFAPGLESVSVRPTASSKDAIVKALGLEKEPDFVAGIRGGWLIGMVAIKTSNLYLGEIITCP